MRNFDFVSAWDEHPDYGVDIETIEYRIQVKFKGKIIADSDNVLLLSEQNLMPKYYFPIEDITQKYFNLTNNVSFSPFKGLASYWSLISGDETIERAAWSYDDPFQKLKEIKSHIAFYQHDDVKLIVDFEKRNKFQISINSPLDEQIAYMVH